MQTIHNFFSQNEKYHSVIGASAARTTFESLHYTHSLLPSPEMQLHNAQNQFVSTMHAHTSSINFIFSQFPKSVLTPKSFNIFYSPFRRFVNSISSSIFAAFCTQNTMMAGNSIFSKSKCLGVDNKLIDSNTQHRLEFIDHHRTCPH